MHIAALVLLGASTTAGREFTCNETDYAAFVSIDPVGVATCVNITDGDQALGTCLAAASVNVSTECAGKINDDTNCDFEDECSSDYCPNADPYGPDDCGACITAVMGRVAGIDAPTGLEGACEADSVAAVMDDLVVADVITCTDNLIGNSALCLASLVPVSNACTQCLIYALEPNLLACNDLCDTTPAVCGTCMGVSFISAIAYCNAESPPTTTTTTTTTTSHDGHISMSFVVLTMVALLIYQ